MRQHDTFWSMPLWLGVVVAVLIIVVRGQVYYWVGRGLGTKLYTSRLGRRIGEERIKRVENLVRTRGALAVFGAHWVPGFRHAVPVSAGMIRMSYIWFNVATVLGAALWTPPWVVGGYAVIWGWLQIAARSPVAAAIVLIVVAALVTAFVVVRRRRRPRPDPQT